MTSKILNYWTANHSSSLPQIFTVDKFTDNLFISNLKTIVTTATHFTAIAYASQQNPAVNVVKSLYYHIIHMNFHRISVTWFYNPNALPAKGHCDSDKYCICLWFLPFWHKLNHFEHPPIPERATTHFLSGTDRPQISGIPLNPIHHLNLMGLYEGFLRAII